MGFPDGAVVKKLPANSGDVRGIVSIPGLGRSPRVKSVSVKVAQPCLTLCDTWNSPGQNTGVGSLLQGIFSTQGLNSGCPHCRQILYQLSHKGIPWSRKWQSITSVFLPGKFHGQRSLEVYSPWGGKSLTQILLEVVENWKRIRCLSNNLKNDLDYSIKLSKPSEKSFHQSE